LGKIHQRNYSRWGIGPRSQWQISKLFRVVPIFNGSNRITHKYNSQLHQGFVMRRTLENCLRKTYTTRDRHSFCFTKSVDDRKRWCLRNRLFFRIWKRTPIAQNLFSSLNDSDKDNPRWIPLKYLLGKAH
jgi:hypothetical protein